MSDATQKTFLDSRKRYAAAKSAFNGMHSVIGVVHAATMNGAAYSGNGWHSMALAGQVVRVKSSRDRFSFDATRWPTGEQIAKAWTECNAAYTAYLEAYKQLSNDDKSYLEVSFMGDPEP